MQAAIPYSVTSYPAHSGHRSLGTTLTRGVQQLQRLSEAIPPSGLVLLSSFAVQIGTALTKSLFETIGTIGAALICKAFAAFLLLCLWRPRIQHHSRQSYWLVGCLGLVIACMSLAFYGAIARIPLGVASTLEFLGPLGIALAGSKRPLDLVWIVLAATGVALLDPISSTSLDPWGIALAVLSAMFWAGYILLSVPTGRVFPGGTGLAMAMAIATLILLPPGLAQGGATLLAPSTLLVGVGVAIMGTVLPYSLEYSALKRMPPRIFGILMSIEPAIAALVGFLFLGEQLGLRALIAVVLVTMAAMGVTLFGRQNVNH